MRLKKYKSKHQANRVDLIRESLKENTSTFYIGMVISVVTVFLLLIVIGIGFQPVDTQEEYSLNTPVSFDTLSMMVTQKYLSADQTTLVFHLTIDSTNNMDDHPIELLIKPELKNKKKEGPLAYNIYTAGPFDYEIVMSDMPTDWQVMRLKIENVETHTTTFFVFNRLGNVDPYERLSENAQYSDDYAKLRLIELEKENYQKDIQNLEQKKEDVIKKMSLLQPEIDALVSQKEFQTTIQQKETDKQISQINRKIAHYIEKLNTIENEKNELNSRKLLLEKKLNKIASDANISLKDIFLTE